MKKWLTNQPHSTTIMWNHGSVLCSPWTITKLGLCMLLNARLFSCLTTPRDLITIVPSISTWRRRATTPKSPSSCRSRAVTFYSQNINDRTRRISLLIAMQSARLKYMSIRRILDTGSTQIPTRLTRTVYKLTVVIAYISSPRPSRANGYSLCYLAIPDQTAQREGQPQVDLHCDRELAIRGRPKPNRILQQAQADVRQKNRRRDPNPREGLLRLLL